MKYKDFTIKTILNKSGDELDNIGALNEARKGDQLNKKTFFAWKISRDTIYWKSINKPVQEHQSATLLKKSVMASSTQGDILKNLKLISPVFQVKYQKPDLYGDEFDQHFLKFHLENLSFIDSYNNDEAKNELYVLLGLLSDRKQLFKLMRKERGCREILGANTACITKLFTRKNEREKDVLVKSDRIFEVLDIYPEILGTVPELFKTTLAKKLLSSQNLERFVGLYELWDVVKNFFQEALSSLDSSKLPSLMAQESLHGPIFDHLEQMDEKEERELAVVNLIESSEDQVSIEVIRAIVGREKSTLLDDLKTYFNDEEYCNQHPKVVKLFFEHEIHEVLASIVPHYKKDNQTTLDLFDEDYCSPEIIKQHFQDEVEKNISTYSTIISSGHKPYITAMRNLVACGELFSELLVKEMGTHVFVAKAVIAAYIKDKGGGEHNDAFETVIGNFLEDADLDDHYKTVDFQAVMRQLFKSKFTSEKIRENMLSNQPVVTDIDSNDKDDFTPYLTVLLNNLKIDNNLLGPSVLKKYGTKLVQRVRDLADDINTNRETLEIVLINYPQIASQLQSTHFLMMLNHPDCSAEFAEAMMDCIALDEGSPVQTNAMRGVLAGCLRRVQNADFFTYLFEKPELLRQTCMGSMQAPQVVLTQNAVLREFLSDKEMHEKLPQLWQNVDLDQIEERLNSPKHSPRTSGLGGASGSKSTKSVHFDLEESDTSSSTI